ncbi:MAG: PASTA domain-containing protein [candidate division WOR-3 bacterium]|nr:MAG: PASTA domain-containing protein [candidate division WOR-3 bacterium]
MYYNGARIFLISFLVSLFTSAIVCALFFFVLPIARGGADTVVPDLIGSNQEQARVIAESRDLLFVVGGEEENEEVPANMIARQTPLPGSVVRSKAAITVFLSKGSSRIVVPDLRNQGLSEATVKLTELGLNIGEVKSEESSEIGKDKIISTIPSAGTRIERGEKIAIVLSRGVQTAEVPRLIGKSFSSAKRIIENGGFVVGNVRYEVSTEFNVGIVMGQNPAPGRQALRGSAIDVVVATVLE